MIFPLLTINLLVCIRVSWASCWQHTDGSCFFNNDFIYEGVRERGRKLGRERNRLPTRSPIWDSIPDSRITPWVKGRGSTPEPPRHPGSCFLRHSDTLYLLIGAFSISIQSAYSKIWTLCLCVTGRVGVSGDVLWSFLVFVAFGLFFPPLEWSLWKFLTGLI